MQRSHHRDMRHYRIAAVLADIPGHCVLLWANW
jgi:hypothetical protein